MAASLNKVFLIGNLTHDPELRYIPSGTAVANFPIAVNRTYRDSSGEQKDSTCFIRVVVWARLAEVCAEYLAKGRPVCVEGRLQSRSWETNDGQKRNTIEVVADNIQFLGQPGGKPAAVRSGGEGAPQQQESSGLEDVEQIDLDNDGEVPF